MTHPMTSPTHYCVACGARWRQNDDFSMSLRDQQCCDACNNTPVGGQLKPLERPAPKWLTDDEISDICKQIDHTHGGTDEWVGVFARAIEAKVRGEQTP